MLKFLSITTLTLLSFAAHSHTNYCPHTHNQDGSSVYQCDDFRYVVRETCSGTETQQLPVQARLREELDGPRPSGSWQWQIQVGDDRWELDLWAPDRNVYRSASDASAVYFPHQYSGRFTHTGSVDYTAERTGQIVRLRGVVTPNLSERPMPRSFDFIMECRSSRD